MRRRFSWRACTAGFLIHFLLTWFLFTASFQAISEWERTGATAPLWLYVSGWIVQPLSMFVSHYLWQGIGPSAQFYLLMLPWMIIVALTLGFVIGPVSPRTI